MNRHAFLRLSGAFFAWAGLSSCATPSVSSGPVAWPVRFASVRAFVYDCRASRSVSFFQKDGSRHRGVINGEGALLTKYQVQRLMPALVTATARPHRTACYLPHHAFVFYDEAGRAVAHSEICFTCAIQRSSPGGLPEHINFQAVWDILREAGVPCGSGSKFYEDLFKAMQ